MSTKKEQIEKTENKNRAIAYLIIIAFIIMIFAAFVIALNNAGLIKFDELKGITKQKAELQYTETNNKVKEGVYMTDVSEVVEAVMPSIVSITSKTLVSQSFKKYRPARLYLSGESFQARRSDFHFSRRSIA